MALHQTQREQKRITLGEAFVVLCNGLRTTHGNQPPTLNFEDDAVVLELPGPIELPCRGATWSAKKRLDEHTEEERHFAAIELGPLIPDHAGPILAERFGGRVVRGPVPIPTDGARRNLGLVVHLPAPPAVVRIEGKRERLFRKDFVTRIATLEAERAQILEANRTFHERQAAAVDDLASAKRAFVTDPTPENSDIVGTCESAVRFATMIVEARTQRVPAELERELVTKRQWLEQLDGSRAAFLTGAVSAGVADGGQFETFDELAQRIVTGAPAPVVGMPVLQPSRWAWWSRFATHRGHTCFGFVVAEALSQRALLERVPFRAVAYRVPEGWSVVAKLSRAATDDELQAVVTALKLGITTYNITGPIPLAGTAVLNVDDVPAVDVDNLLQEVGA